MATVKRTRGLSFDSIDEALIADVTDKIDRIPYVTHSQAEEAVMEGLLSLLEKADEYQDRDLDSLKGLLYTFARFKALHIRDKAMKHRADSLDSMIEVADETGQGRRALGEALTDESFDADAHDEIIDLTRNPILARKFDAVTKGGSHRVMGRGEHHPHARYSDEQVQRVRELRADGCSRAEVAKLTGVPIGYISNLANREGRTFGSTEGWTRDLMIYAVQRWAKENGRTPTSREPGHALPGNSTVKNEFGPWNALLRAAGFEPVRAYRPAWNDQDIARALFGFRCEHGRWPNKREINYTKGLPTILTIQRHWGTGRLGEIVERAIDEIAALVDPDCTCSVGAR